MRVRRVRTRYYRQFDADHSLRFPARGYGGWEEAHLPLDLDRTALVVMHAWDAGTRQEFPGWYRAVEYLPRANDISATVFPELIAATRDARVSVLHVVGGSDYYSGRPEFGEVEALAPVEEETVDAPADDAVLDELKRFRAQHVFPGTHNHADIQRGLAALGFNEHAAPLAGEGIAATTDQLDTLCRRLGVNHLVYIGFAIDGCLLISPGGMVDMQRLGYVCSVIPEAVTAIENRETIEAEQAKSLALWRVALLFGFLYDLDDFTRMLSDELDDSH